MPQAAGCLTTHRPRDGSFEGDYNELASTGGYTYIARCQGSRPTPASRRR